MRAALSSKSTRLSVAFLSLTLALTGAHPPKPSTRPDIVFIMADDMGFSDIGCYGGEVNTPNIDRLAAGGIKTRSFYNNARCCPTRASLLTGRYPHSVGMGHMVTLPKDRYDSGSYQGFLTDRHPTIAEELRKTGYSTYMSGKWHVGERRAHWPARRGFDRYFGLISGTSSYYEVTPGQEDRRFYALDDSDYRIPTEGYYATDAFTDRALEFLEGHMRERSDKPFFLYLAYTAPHFPLHAPEEDVERYGQTYADGWDEVRRRRYENMRKVGYVDGRHPLTPRTEGIPAWKGDEGKKQWVRRMAVYAAMVDRMDRNIGRLVEALKRNGRFENTLIVFLSDNGANAEILENRKLHDPSKRIGERGSYAFLEEPWANVSNTPFRLYKHHVHEGGILTPCIMHWPAVIRPRKGFREGVGHVMDLMPTALELAGVKTEGLHGRSLSHFWTGRKEGERTLCWEHEGNKAIRKGAWKLVKEHDQAEWRLYDMRSDPTESRDLAAAQRERVASMLAEYHAWEEEVGVRDFTGRRFGEKPSQK